jgi:3-hydroxy-9,10-secoandrosta-1,3,5(10)-triene-9,17-dione monooxygenase
MFEADFELARGCGSTGWCYAIWSVHTWLVGHWPEQAQEDFFATGPDTLASSAFSPVGAKIERAPGGYRVSGRWDFSSGSDSGDWAMLGAFSQQDGLIWVLVPRKDYSIVDTWFVSGMRGTGSKDIQIDDAFVPRHRTLDVTRAGEGDWTGWDLHKRLTYRLPLRAMLGWDLASPLVGIGQGAVDEFTDRLVGTSGRGRTAESVAVQLRLAEASAEVDAARLLHRTSIRGILAKAERQESYSELDRALYQRNKAYVSKLCVQAVNRLFEASGGHALFDSQPIQRMHRDVHAGSHQMALNWDTAAEHYGALRLRGQDDLAGHPMALFMSAGPQHPPEA